ncbi:MAG: hypothetical protein CMG71_03995 [Candidatus Marinimicrobia bacterium]|nr:hypothetical protein [Candidatus Neomarinimicrobiota bacterium]
MDADLRTNIESAQSIRGIPPSEIMTPYPSIRSLLDSQVRRYGDRTYLYWRENGENLDISFGAFFDRVSQCANYLRKEKVAFGDTVALTGKGPYRSLIELFGIWAVGGTANINGKDSPFPSESNRFDDALAEEHKVADVGKKSKLADDCLILKNGNGRTFVLSHYNLIVSGMAIAEKLQFNDKDTLSADGERIDLLTIATVMTGLYTGCRINLRGGKASDQEIRAIFTHHPQEFPLTKSAIVPHSASNRKYQGSLITGFFMPELTGFASLGISANEEEKQLLHVGEPLHPCEMTILDEEGEELTEGKLGRLVVRGHNVMKGYTEDEEANRNIFAGGWLNTGTSAEARKNADGSISFFVVFS